MLNEDNLLSKNFKIIEELTSIANDSNLFAYGLDANCFLGIKKWNKKTSIDVQKILVN